MPQRVAFTVPLIRVWLYAFAVGAYGCLSHFKSHPPFTYIPDIPVALDAVLSFALALLIAFRVNRAYERWWEARTLWGNLVNVSRNLAVKIRALERPGREDCRKVRNIIVAFCLGLKDHLRDDPDLSRLPGFEDDKSVPNHLPSYIARKLYDRFHDWQTAGSLSDEQLWVFDAEARSLLDVCGGCERIKTTMMPISWRLVTWQCIGVYLIVLPWGLVDDFGTWTIPLTILAAYLVIAAELIAQYVEEPFGIHEDHLDLERICDGIDRSVSEVLLDGGQTKRS
jgi:ion channel-forming bestrophin family protein